MSHHHVPAPGQPFYIVVYPQNREHQQYPPNGQYPAYQSAASQQTSWPYAPAQQYAAPAGYHNQQPVQPVQPPNMYPMYVSTTDGPRVIYSDIYGSTTQHPSLQPVVPRTVPDLVAGWNQAPVQQPDPVYEAPAQRKDYSDYRHTAYTPNYHYAPQAYNHAPAQPVSRAPETHVPEAHRRQSWGSVDNSSRHSRPLTNDSAAQWSNRADSGSPWDMANSEEVDRGRARANYTPATSSSSSSSRGVRHGSAAAASPIAINPWAPDPRARAPPTPAAEVDGPQAELLTPDLGPDTGIDSVLFTDDGQVVVGEEFQVPSREVAYAEAGPSHGRARVRVPSSKEHYFDRSDPDSDDFDFNRNNQEEVVDITMSGSHVPREWNWAPKQYGSVRNRNRNRNRG
ncbi:hypothetical protein F5B20DRAFT_449993 [Whalleya microplaca]|nr:hypothetical protein F5B20DRAFT_449993 [Whalleya microplaca]